MRKFLNWTALPTALALPPVQGRSCTAERCFDGEPSSPCLPMELAEPEAQKEHSCGRIPPQSGSLQMVLADRHIHRRSFRISGSPLRAMVLVAALNLFAAARAAPAMADLGPCITAAPTTRDVHLFVSDVDRAARWYRDNAGLTELHRWIDQTFNGATLVSMQRGLAGVTLVGSARDFTGGFRDPQMVCLVLGGPPAPATGTSPLFLVDPDGTSVELPSVPTHLSITP